MRTKEIWSDEHVLHFLAETLPAFTETLDSQIEELKTFPRPNYRRVKEAMEKQIKDCSLPLGRGEGDGEENLAALLLLMGKFADEKKVFLTDFSVLARIIPSALKMAREYKSLDEEARTSYVEDAIKASEPKEAPALIKYVNAEEILVLIGDNLAGYERHASYVFESLLSGETLPDIRRAMKENYDLSPASTKDMVDIVEFAGWCSVCFCLQDISTEKEQLLPDSAEDIKAANRELNKRSVVGHLEPLSSEEKGVAIARGMDALKKHRKK